MKLLHKFQSVTGGRPITEQLVKLGLTDIEKYLGDCDNETKISKMKFIAYAWDIESPFLNSYNQRSKDKVKILDHLKITDTKLRNDLLNNSDSLMMQLTAWYVKQIRDLDYEAILTGFDHAQHLFAVSRDRSNMENEDGSGKLDYDKALKAEEYRHKCYMNGLETMKEIKVLNDRFEARYKDLNRIIKDELPAKVREQMGVAELKAYELEKHIQ